MQPYYEHAGILIYHGDCKEILPLIPSVDLVLADPPYGINYVHGSTKSSKKRSKFDGVPVYGDDKPFDPGFLFQYNKKFILWGGNHYIERLPSSRGWLIWDKRCGTTVNSMGDAEIAWTNLIGCLRIFYHVWNGFVRGPESGIERDHPTQKPIGLMKWCIGFCPEAKTILDPYMGSGTTLVAAKQLGLQATGIEIEEKYCEAAARRLSQEALPFHKEEKPKQQGFF